MNEQILSQIFHRRSFRAFDPTPLPEDQVRRLLEAAVLAPSCSNNQPWRFVAITEPGQLERLHSSISSGNYWAKAAPLAVAVITSIQADCQEPGERDYAYFDTGMATMNLLLQAQNEGLNSHLIAGFDAQKAGKILSVPEDWTLLTLGFFGMPGDPGQLSEKHQKQEAAPRNRKALEEVVSFQKMEQE